MPSILSKILETTKQEKTSEKTSTKSKVLDFGKMIADQARSQGILPRTYLEQLCLKSESFAKSNLVKILMGEQDVPQQKGRDAKPEVLTKRAMNVVKKGIKQAANKQRRRMDKDAVEEDGKDEFSKHVNPMGGDSVKLAKIKKSPGFYDMIVTFFSSAVQDDRDDEEVLPIMSSMFNMNVEEIKAVLRQYGGHTFSGQSPEDKFKTNMKATGFLGKGKSRTLNSVYEDEHQDRGYAQMIIQQHPEEYKKFMQTGDLMDAPSIYEKLFAYFSSSDASDMMPYGTQKARDGDPYVWLVDKLDDLGLTEGNEFAQKVRQMKAAGAKKGTKFKTSDGEEHTLENVLEKMVLMKDQVADAVADKVKDWAKSATVEQINKVLAMIKSPAKLKPEGPTSASMEEDKTDAEIDAFHTELDRLVHKYFGHSSDEKREKVKEDDDKGEVMVGSYQTKHFDICPSATQLYKDIDVKDMDLAERSAKLHDTLFYMEKHAKEMKEADPEYIEMMQNLADQIMAMAGMMGLESEHSYVQGHVDAVKNLGESVEAITEEEFDEAAGEKDACYHKVKSRYKVWPSAYASGALVKCRKVGASNWGNKSK